ncbi:MAG: hypothetical protein LBR79_03260 [Oscillospiraceae bacterium]|nr:hypothetical protein [Oscillospiraceae bacterium]
MIISFPPARMRGGEGISTVLRHDPPRRWWPKLADNIFPTARGRGGSGKKLDFFKGH